MLRRAQRPARVAAAVLIGLVGSALPRNLQSAPAGDDESTQRAIAFRSQSARFVSASATEGDAAVALLAPSPQPLSALSAEQHRHLEFLRGLPGAGDPQVMRLNADLTGVHALRLDLAHERSWLAVRRAIDLDGSGTTAWYGDLAQGGYALFVRRNDFLHGIVQTNGDTFKVSPLGERLCAVQRISPRAVNAPICAVDAGEARDAGAPWKRIEPNVSAADMEWSQQGNGAQLATEPLVIIDVLVAYESSITHLVPDVVGHIEFLAAWANASYINSRIHTAAGPCWQGERCVMPQLRIVATAALECPGCIDTTLSNLFLNNRFAIKDDGWFDEVHGLRDEVAADVCVLLTALDRPGSSGSSKQDANADWAFCLAEAPFSLLHPWIFAHEVGHLQGGGHEVGSTREYARAYCHNPGGGDPEERFSTIMCTQSFDRIPYWSNPELEYEPVPGRVFRLGADDRNNARRLNETSLVVASHRGRIVTPIDVANFEARLTGNEARLSWRFSYAALQELDGVHVQRAEVAAGPYHNRTSTPLSPALEMSWVDAQLPRGRASWYRLKLMQSNGAEEIVGPAQVSARPWTNLLLHPQVDDAQVVIRYNVGPAPAWVWLGIYDVRGRVVRVLERGLRGTGEFEVRWDRSDREGRPVARGVYMIQLTTDGQQSLRKLLLLRD